MVSGEARCTGRCLHIPEQDVAQRPGQSASRVIEPFETLSREGSIRRLRQGEVAWSGLLASVTDEQPQQPGNLGCEHRRCTDHQIEEHEDRQRLRQPPLCRCIACGIKRYKQPEGQHPEDRTGIGDVDVAAIGKQGCLSA